MTAQEYNNYIAVYGAVTDGSPEHQFMHKVSQDAIRLTMEINNSYHTPEELRGSLSEQTGEQIDSTVGLFPPIYSDYGKNLHIGKNVFINMGCKFQDQGGIFIGDGAIVEAGAVVTKDVAPRTIEAYLQNSLKT